MEVQLVFVRKDRTTQSFKLPSAVTFIGRRQDCDLCIPLSVVSRRHCEIYTEFDKVFIRDLKSRNSTFVNDEAIDEAVLKAGDVLRIGPVQFVVQVDGVPDNFDDYFPAQAAEPAKPEAAVPPQQDETQEADFEDVLSSIDNDKGGQSQTMDIDNIFGNDFLGNDDFDLDSDQPT